MFEIISWLFISYFAIANLTYFFLLIASFFSIRQIVRARPFKEALQERLSHAAPPISIIAPAFNEAATVADSVQSFILTNYPKHEVILVNDGSTDQTIEILKKHFELEPARIFYDNRLSATKIKGVYRSKSFSNLMVIDKENGGKADAINVGVGFARYDHICAVDSDSILDDDALLSVVLPFIEDPDTTIASGGTIRPVNGSKVRFGKVLESRLPSSLLPLIQIVEYLRAFLFGRVGWTTLNATLIISGAFGIFRKDVVIDAGGYRHDTVGEDMELILRLRKTATKLDKPHRIAFSPDPICWTEVPSTWATLGRQRDRWQRGLAETLMTHRDMTLNPKFGWVGFVAMPYFFIFELFGPLIEVVGYFYMISGVVFGWVDPTFFKLFIICDLVYGILMSLGAVLIEESAYYKYPRLSEILKILLVAPLEYLGYRQILLFYRLKGLWKYLMGDKTWGLHHREGFDSSK